MASTYSKTKLFSSYFSLSKLLPSAVEYYFEVQKSYSDYRLKPDFSQF